MDFEFEPYKVYVRVDADNFITAVNSSEFLEDTTGWVMIDEGYGDKYHHAQGNYFPLPIMTEGLGHRYRLVDGVVTEMTDEQVSDEEADIPKDTRLTQEERITDLEEAMELLLSGVTE